MAFILTDHDCNYCIIDTDECKSGLHDCLKNLSECLNTVGSYNCVCNPGYQGDGKTSCISVTHGEYIYIYMCVCVFVCINKSEGEVKVRRL